MVQKEIKKKTPIYSLIGILTAIILFAMIYSYGTTPTASPPLASPSSTPNVPLSSPSPQPVSTNIPEASSMKTFSSIIDLTNFLTTYTNNSQNALPPVAENTGTSNQLTITPSVPSPAPAPTSAPASATAVGPVSKGTGTTDYSTTNIQVAGVDEADTVKTDGKYLYVIANNSVYILNADPQNAQMLSKIATENSYLQGIYLSQDGNKLAVLGTQWVPYYPDLKSSYSADLIMPYWGGGTTFVNIYDVSDRANPVLARNFTISGNYFNSRMIGNNVYTILTESVYLVNDAVNLPTVFAGTKPFEIAPTSIYFVPIPDTYYTYATFISLNIMDDSQAPTNTTIMMGGTSDMYVSANNIYVTYTTWSEQGQDTNIYRIGINEGALTFEAKGTVPGSVLNQYAMDEYNGYFRLATNQWFNDNATTSDGAVFQVSRQKNSIYVLNVNLAIVGKLEKIKMDESLYSVRFMGDKCYVVTFKQTDPFFVIDMRNPAAPKIAGQLNIPGYSSYLHPYDNNTIIGVGKENNTVKLSLFDVTNVNAPKEIAKFVVDASWSDSAVLQDPKAFLFDAQKQLLVIPISINNMITPIVPMPLSTTQGVTGTPIVPPTLSFWQGVYVFNVKASGFTLRGNITQQENNNNPQDNSYYWNGDYWINRALYIGNTLYTLSNARVQLNSVDSLAQIAKIDLS